MIQDILDFSKEEIAQGKSVALVTVTKTFGSSPASVGQMMAINSEGKTCGTIGGGATEFQITNQAIEAIKSGENVFHFHRNHGESGMVCGGEMEGFGTLLGSENHLYIFGGGHVAKALADIAIKTGFFVSVVEDREELKDSFSDEVNFILCDPKEYEEKLHFNGTAYVVIATRGHKTDDDALRFSLSQKTKYLGMIGSSKKVSTLFHKLKADGYSQEQMESIYTPIGLNIASAVPAEIAVSILAEMLLVKNGGENRSKKDSEN